MGRTDITAMILDRTWNRVQRNPAVSVKRVTREIVKPQLCACKYAYSRNLTTDNVARAYVLLSPVYKLSIIRNSLESARYFNRDSRFKINSTLSPELYFTKISWLIIEENTMIPKWNRESISKVPYALKIRKFEILDRIQDPSILPYFQTWNPNFFAMRYKKRRIHRNRITVLLFGNEMLNNLAKLRLLNVRGGRIVLLLGRLLSRANVREFSTVYVEA